MKTSSTTCGKLLDFGKAILRKRQRARHTEQWHLEQLAAELTEQIKALPYGSPRSVSNVRYFLRCIEFHIANRSETRTAQGGRS